MTRLYTDLASWWPLLSAPEEYAEEAAFYEKTLVEACERPPRTLLEIGSGGGNNASFHLKDHFQSSTDCGGNDGEDESTGKGLRYLGSCLTRVPAGSMLPSIPRGHSCDPA